MIQHPYPATIRNRKSVEILFCYSLAGFTPRASDYNFLYRNWFCRFSHRKRAGIFGLGVSSFVSSVSWAIERDFWIVGVVSDFVLTSRFHASYGAGAVEISESPFFFCHAFAPFLPLSQCGHVSVKTYIPHLGHLLYFDLFCSWFADNVSISSMVISSLYKPGIIPMVC